MLSLQIIQFFLSTWNNFFLYFTFHVIQIAASSLPQIIRLTGGKKTSLHSWNLWVAHQYILSYYLCSLVTVDWAKNICIYGTQADGDQWKQCTGVLQRDRLQSGWEWERGWGRMEREPAHRLPMFGRELICSGERSGWTAPRVVLK